MSREEIQRLSTGELRRIVRMAQPVGWDGMGREWAREELERRRNS